MTSYRLHWLHTDFILTSSDFILTSYWINWRNVTYCDFIWLHMTSFWLPFDVAMTSLTSNRLRWCRVTSSKNDVRPSFLSLKCGRIWAGILPALLEGWEGQRHVFVFDEVNDSYCKNHALERQTPTWIMTRGSRTINYIPWHPGESLCIFARSRVGVGSLLFALIHGFAELLNILYGVPVVSEESNMGMCSQTKCVFCIDTLTPDPLTLDPI